MTTSTKEASSSASAKLTKYRVDREPLVTEPVVTKGGKEIWQRIVRDTELRGFGLLIGQRTKSFFFQQDIRDANGERKTVRRSLGQYGVDVTPDEARKAAKDLIAELNKGVVPTAKRRQTAEAEQEGGTTFAEAVELFRKSKGKNNRPRAPKTQKRYAQFVSAGYLAEWMERPLASITRKEVRERHEALTKEVASGVYVGERRKGRALPKWQSGKTTADGVMFWFRAVWNRAMEDDETLPANPIIALTRMWHKPTAERTAIPSARLEKWYAGVSAIPNPVRRDYLLFTLFSGLRRKSAEEMRWEDVDWTRRVLRIPRPKGGEERAFDLPLSDYLLDLLKERQRQNPELIAMQMIPEDSLEWVFPAYSSTGHISEPRESIDGVPFTIHDLRRTFITVAESLDIPLQVIGTLVNHRQPGGSVTAGYVAHETERLRAPMQAITDALLRSIAGPGPANVVPMQRRAKG